MPRKDPSADSFDLEAALAELERSGLSTAASARVRGVPAWKLYAAQRRRRAGRLAERSGPSSSAFVPVQIAAPLPSDAVFEVELPTQDDLDPATDALDRAAPTRGPGLILQRDQLHEARLLLGGGLAILLAQLPGPVPQRPLRHPRPLGQLTVGQAPTLTQPKPATHLLSTIHDPDRRASAPANKAGSA